MPPKKAKATVPVASSSSAAKKTPTTKSTTTKAKPKTNAAPDPPAKTKPAEVDVEGLEEWEQLSNKKWRGLGLSDPIKSVEVRLVYIHISPSI